MTDLARAKDPLDHLPRICGGRLAAARGCQSTSPRFSQASVAPDTQFSAAGHRRPFFRCQRFDEAFASAIA